MNSASEMNLTVRKCQAGDALSLAAREPVGANIALGLYARQERGETIFLVALLNDVPLASVELVLGKMYELRNLHVHQRARRHGIGTALIQAAQEYCVGRSELAIKVGIKNVAARRLYERLGFVGTGKLTTSNYRYVDSAGVHEVTETDEILIKRLEEAPN